MARAPLPVRNKLPLIRSLFAHIDASGTTRHAVWKRAGYPPSDASIVASGRHNTRLSSFVDLCDAAGLDIVLVPKERTE